MSRGHLVMEHAIDQIREGHSYRRDLGDLEELTESVRRFGLLSPIVITTGNVLISGNRRLAVLRSLGHRTVPVWIVPGVSDKLSMVVAIQDENTLHKMLAPLEQAELYAELKELYAEENARKQEATQFGATTPSESAHNFGPAPGDSGGGNGGVDSTPPQPARGEGQKTRVQAAKAVTGRDSHGMLDQVVELKQIAASEAEHPEVRQAAAEALLELNTDGKVNGRFLRVKLLQQIHTLRRWATHPDEPDGIRAAAASELALVEAQEHPKDALTEATRAIGRLTQLRADAAVAAGPAGWKDADPLLREKHAIRKLVDLLRREHGWWDRYDPTDFGTYADQEQWELVETYITEASRFVERARAAREKHEEGSDADG
ncbi:ParB N-terminal domain-containing protein [Microbacterium sp. NPDC077663]|uniref:ParB N-terminal domain-containing protein n=1 Tax=Microbacterium sp. NPDC077663 TaxID=3364189 RepID=UPI0037C61653